MKITSIGVEYGRTVQVDGQYTSRSGKAIIQYAFEEDEVADEATALARAEQAAIASVTRMLQSNGSQPLAEAYMSTAKAVPTPAAEPIKVDKRTKAGKAQANISTGGERIDPAQIEAAKPEVKAAASGPASLVSMEDVSAAIDFSEPMVPAKVAAVPEPVSDADMDKACQNKMQALVKEKGKAVGEASTMIRGLIGTYNPDPSKPFGMKQIAAISRAEFLQKLKVL